MFFKFFSGIAIGSLIALGSAISPEPSSAQTLIWSEDFDSLVLNPNVDETVVDFDAFTLDPPPGWSITNGPELESSGGGVLEWRGWSFADPGFWAAVAGQRRDEFTFGQNVIAVADSDEFDDITQIPDNVPYATFLTTNTISVTGVPAGELFLRFASSWRPESNQTATITASYDGGAPVEVLRFESGGPNTKPDAPNEKLIVALNNPAGASNAVLEFGYFDSQNNWWWAIDNLEVFNGEPRIFDEAMRVTINRDTGLVTLINDTGAAVLTKGYQIVSDAGALDEAAFTPLADSDPNWIQLSTPGVARDLSEGHLGTGTIAAGAQISLGNAWLKYPEDVDDVVFQYLDETGAVVDGLVEFRGNDGQSFIFGDLNFDNQVDIGDWLLFKDGVGQDLSGSSPAQGYRIADLNGDRRHSPADFILFERAFDLANGAGALAAVGSGAVPEPSTYLLLGLCASVMIVVNRRSLRVKLLAQRAVRGATRACLAIVAVLVLSTDSSAQLIIFQEDFNGVPLGPNVEEALPGEKVWTDTPPPGWRVDDSGVPGANDPALNGVVEWAGWSFANVQWWAETAGDQNRTQFTRASGAVAVADPDEWDDAPNPNELYNALLFTPPLTVTGLPANSAIMAFDSSWRPEGQDDLGATNNQTGLITVSYDGGPEIELLRWESIAGMPNFKGDATNEHVTLNLQNPAGANEAVLKFGLLEAYNDWWWAIDNVSISVPANPLQLVIDVQTGQASIKSNDTIPIPINSYSITSQSGSLNAEGWRAGNFDARDLDGMGGGGSAEGDYNNGGQVEQGDLDLVLLNWGNPATPPPGGWTNDLPEGIIDQAELDGVLLNWGNTGGGGNPGEGWEVLTGSGRQLFEAFLLGNSSFAEFREESIGAAFQPGGTQDLVFSYSTIFGQEQFGEVVYAVPGAGIAAVPEPASLVLMMAFGAGLLAAHRCRKGVRSMKTLQNIRVTAAMACLTLTAVESRADGLLNRHYTFENGSAGQGISVAVDTVTVGFEDEDLFGIGATYQNLAGTGRTGLGASFDGSLSFLEGNALNDPSQSPSAASQDLSNLFDRGFQFWAFPRSSGGGARQDVVMDTDQHGVFITGQNTWGYRFAGQDYDSGVGVAFNDWTHVQLTSFQGPGATLYLDGEAVGAIANRYDRSRATGSSPWSLAVGANAGDNNAIFVGSENFYDGIIDDLKFSIYGTNPSFDVPFNFAVDNDIAIDFFGSADPADVNLDGVVAGNGMGPVETDDVSAFVAGWMSRNLLPTGEIAGDINTRRNGDLNFDGITDIADWGILNLANPAAGAAALSAISGAGVPEPSTLVLALAGITVVCAIARRRR